MADFHYDELFLLLSCRGFAHKGRYPAGVGRGPPESRGRIDLTDCRNFGKANPHVFENAGILLNDVSETEDLRPTADEHVQVPLEKHRDSRDTEAGTI